VAPVVTGRGRGSRLRGTTIVAAPLFVVALIALTLAVATLLWGAWEGHDRGAAWWATLLVSGAVGVGALACVRGCFIEVDDRTVRDVVAWVPVHRFERARIATARVRRGAWRVYVVELDDGKVLTLLGASPLQWPTRLLPGAMERDRDDLDLLMGDDPMGDDPVGGDPMGADA
jgi:hypothetical protein